jgi:hypothetical protein
MLKEEDKEGFICWTPKRAKRHTMSGEVALLQIL